MALSQTTREPSADIRAQIKALIDYRHPKDAVFIAPVNRSDVPKKLPPSVHRVSRADGTLLTTNLTKANRFRSSKNLSDGDMAKILGYPESKASVVGHVLSGKAAKAVQARDRHGNVITEAVTSSEGAEGTARALRPHVPKGGRLAEVSLADGQRRRRGFADGGDIDADTKPSFDAAQPFDVVGSHPSQTEAAAPAFDSSQPFDTVEEHAPPALPRAEGSDILPEDANYSYGTILPYRVEKGPMRSASESGGVLPFLENHIAVPEALRSPIRGAVEWGRNLAGQGRSPADMAAPPSDDQINALASLAGAKPFGMSSVARGSGADIAEAAAIEAAADSPQKILTDAGVRLTPGQKIGGLAKAAEDKAAGTIPVTGDAIVAARRRGLGDFNIATINKALEPIGKELPKGTKPGESAIEAGQESLDSAYGDLLPKLSFKLDKQALDSIDSLRDLTSEMPAGERDQFDAILKQRVLTRMGAGKSQPTMDGQTLKMVESELTQKVGQLKAGGQYQLSDAVKELRATLRDNLARQNPDHADQLQNINKAYAMFSRAEDASIRRVASRGVFTPSDLLSEVRANAKRTGNKRAYARGDNDLKNFATAGQEVLPSEIPDSGTAARLMQAGIGGGAVSAAFLGNPLPLGGIVAGALPYTRFGQSALDAAPRAASSALGAAAPLTRVGGPFLMPNALRRSQQGDQ